MSGIYLAIHGAVIVGSCLVIAALAQRKRRHAQWIAAALFVMGVPSQLAVLAYPRLPAQFASALGWADLVFFSQLWVHLACAITVAGTLAQESRGARLRTSVLGVLLLVVALVGTTTPILEPRPLDRPAYLDTRVAEYPVVRQTAPSTCAPAAAATLLRALGIEPAADEATLALRCLTDPSRGTSDLGLFRGLAVSVPKARVDYSDMDLAGLHTLSQPCLIFVGFSAARVEDPKLRADLQGRAGWDDGQLHAVVFFGFDKGRPGEDQEVALIGDPRMGFERWGITHFRALYDGSTLRIVQD